MDNTKINTDSFLKKTERIQDYHAEVVSSVTTRLAVASVLALLTLIITAAISTLWISELLSETADRFFILAGFYALIVILLYTLRHKWIKIPVFNFIVTKLWQ